MLVHAAAGGVGMAAVQIARHLGAEVYGTASPAKWPRTGLDERHLSSSRDTGFRSAFLEATGGRGVDVVLNSLAGEFVDASLGLMPNGGRFLEMGKTDMRDAGVVASAYPVSYEAFDLFEAGPGPHRGDSRRAAGAVRARRAGPLPVTTWDLGRAREAFRVLQRAEHTGKLVLRIPSALDSVRNRPDHRRHRNPRRASWPATSSNGTASGTCCSPL